MRMTNNARRTTKKKAATGGKKTSAKKATGAKSEKVIYKDVEIAYLAEGLNAVKTMIEGGIKPAVVRRAADELSVKYPEKADMLRMFVENSYPSTVRGRLPPTAGEERDYKAQQVKTGAPFLRLPLDLLGIKKGQVATVSFNEDKIEVWKKTA